jgi:hypothetical protein
VSAVIHGLLEEDMVLCLVAFVVLVDNARHGILRRAGLDLMLLINLALSETVVDPE